MKTIKTTYYLSKIAQMATTQPQVQQPVQPQQQPQVQQQQGVINNDITTIEQFQKMNPQQKLQFINSPNFNYFLNEISKTDIKKSNELKNLAMNLRNDPQNPTALQLLDNWLAGTLQWFFSLL